LVGCCRFVGGMLIHVVWCHQCSDRVHGLGVARRTAIG
jgi:hypothetical protein